MSKLGFCAWLALCLLSFVSAAPAEGPGTASFWIARAADQHLAMAKPHPDDYLDVITALTYSGDLERLRRVVAKYEAALVADMEGQDEAWWMDAYRFLCVAEGWARAGDAAGFTRSVARADIITAQINDDTKDRIAEHKARVVAFRDAGEAIALVRALPGKTQPERFTQVAWACAEMRNADGVRRALEEAGAAADRFLDEPGRRRTRAGGVRVLVIAGDLAAAEQAASRLAPEWSMQAYAKIVEAHHVAGRANEVDRLMKHMAAIVRDAEASHQVSMANNFADCAVDVGRGPEAAPVVRLAEQNAAPPDDPVRRGEWLSTLAIAYARAEDFGACRRVLDEALKLRSDLRAALLTAEAKRRAAEAGEDDEPAEDQGFEAWDENGTPLWLRAQREFDDSGLNFAAYALARAGRVDDATALVEQVDRHEKERAMMWLARGAAGGDPARMRQVADAITGKVEVFSVARWVAEELAGRKHTAELVAWAESRPDDRHKLAANLGAAEGMTRRLFWEPRLGM